MNQDKISFIRKSKVSDVIQSIESSCFRMAKMAAVLGFAFTTSFTLTPPSRATTLPSSVGAPSAMMPSSTDEW